MDLTDNLDKGHFNQVLCIEAKMASHFLIYFFEKPCGIKFPTQVSDKSSFLYTISKILKIIKVLPLQAMTLQNKRFQSFFAEVLATCNWVHVELQIKKLYLDTKLHSL